MQIEINIDEQVKETRIVITTAEVDDNINELLRRISEDKPQVIAGFQEDRVRLLDQGEIYRIYAGEGKVFCTAYSGVYVLRMRLYELEERLDKRRFVRISNSEIINLRYAKGFDLSFTGTIRVEMENGETAFVSRRYVSKIKKVLGL